MGSGVLYPLSRPVVAFGLILATLVALIVFNRFPGIDQAVSAWFFAPAPCDTPSVHACGKFPAAANPLLREMRTVFHYMPATVAVLLLIAALFALRRPAPGARQFARGVFVAVASILLCSVLIVNVWLKSFSGRPRPVATDIFGGELPFVPAGEFTSHCASNCSFVSGEASIVFWLVCLTPLAPPRWRLPALVVTLSIALFASGLRVAFGAHYLSDVTVAGLLALSTFAVLASAASRAGLLAPEIPSTLR